MSLEPVAVPGRSEAMVQVLEAFGVADVPTSVERITAGHIHGTWVVRAGGRRYVAQSVNRSVFVDLEACEENLSRLDRHLAGHPHVLVPRSHRTAAGTVHWTGPGGAAWRLTDFAEGTVAGTVAVDAHQAHDVAGAFGRYVAALTTIDGGPLRPTIDRFHDLAWRCTQLRAAAARNDAGRLVACGDDVAAVDQMAARVAGALAAVERRHGPLPIRPVHNDAKVANVRFDTTGRAAVIVDLDTTMPGTVVFDLGELLRTATVDGPEDGVAAGAAGVDDERVTAVVRGLVGGLGVPPSAGERAAMPWAGPLMAVENAVRFLADHLNGDGYFGADRPGQNLDRARAQLAVAVALAERADLVSRAAR